MKVKRMQIKKKLVLLLSSALLVTSMNVIPVKAAENNQATGSEVENAEASTKLSLEIASAPATGQTHDEGWKNLNAVVIPDSESGTYKITENGNYYLSGDITCTSGSAAVLIATGVTATICLEGHTISSTGTAISVPSGASLTVEDCSEPESKTGSGKVTSSCDNSTIEAKGYLEVKRVNVTNTNYEGIVINAINEEGSVVSNDSVVIKNSKLSGICVSLSTERIKNITIESTECTGRVSTLFNTNMTVLDSTIISDNAAIAYYNGNHSEVNITNSVLTTTSITRPCLESDFTNGPVIINIEGSTLNAPEYAIKVEAGEKIKISNSKLLCSNTEKPEHGCAIYYAVSEQDGRNSLEITGGEITGKEIDGAQKGWNTGIFITNRRGYTPEMNLTLSGNIKFGRTNPLNTDIAFPLPSENATINLNMNSLRTRDMVINAYSGEMQNIICDGDYSTYFKDPIYLFNSVAKDTGKYVLNCTPRSITRQPTAENPQIAVDDASNVSYQWYSVESYENAVTNETIVTGGMQLGRYEGGFWKPEQWMPDYSGDPYTYCLAVKLNAGDLVILEDPDGKLELMKDILLCRYAEGITEKEYKEYKDGKLYFTIPSDGVYMIEADVNFAYANWPINANTRLKIAVKGTKVTGEVTGNTQANLVPPEAGTFYCKATWAKGTAFEYSVLSDVVTVTQAIIPSKYTVTVNGGTSAFTEYAAGETVTITANPAPEGKEFDKWEVTSGGVTLADASKSTTTFIMPESAVTVKATYKDVSEAPTETLTNIDIQVDTTKIPTLKVGDSIPDYGSQSAENSPFSFSDEVSYYFNSDDRTSYGFGHYEYDEEGYYTDSEGKRLNSYPCIEKTADATTLYAYYIELIAATGYTFGDAVTICNGNNSHFVVEEIGEREDREYIRIRYDMGTLQDIEDIKNESGGTTPDTDKILAEAKEIVTSKINELSVSNLTTDKDIKNAIETALLSDDKTKTVGSEIKVTKTEAEVGKDGQIAINVKLSLNGEDITFDLNKVIDKLEGKNITVTVKDGNDNPVSGATVKVMLGNTEKANSTSSEQGSCTFNSLPLGFYNVVVAKDGVKKTAIADLTKNHATVYVKLDTSSVGSSHLDVKGTTVPETAAKVEETVVSNLDTLAEALKETDAAVDSYKVEMMVEAKADTYVSKSTKSEMVKEANKGETGAENKATNIDFLDIVIQKTITKNSVEQKPELIKDTGTTVMEIIIPFNFTGKTKVKVLREHDGVVEKFDETNPGTDGTCKIDRENERIILYATKFSTYAVSYVAEGESAIEPATPPAYTGGGNSTPSTPSGGDSKPSTPTEEYTIPVESENAVEVKAEIKEGTADVSEITEETLSKVTDAKGESNVNTIKIDLSGAKQEVTGVTISKKSVETLAKATNDTTNGIDTVTIELSKATVVLDTKTLETLVEDAKGTNIRLVVDDKEHKELNTSQQTAVKDYHVATSFEAYFESDGVRIHDFKGGKATVSIEFTPETGKSIEHYHMVYLPDAGGMTRFKTKYENGQLIFTTTHFSDYAVIYDENEKNETGNEEEKPVEQKPAETQVAANAIAINKGLKVSQTGTKINVSWGKAADADGYLVYAAYCGTDFENAVKTIKDPSSVSTTITKINGKKLDLKKNFKVYVKAYKLADGKKVAFGTSITAHITGTKNAKNTNVKELKLTSKSKLTLAVGKTSKIKAKVVLVDSAKKQLSDSHTKEFRYASSNKKVAAVDKNGKITAKAKGTCYIYVYARNGYAKKVTVTVN